jgi:HEAT repeat protein
MSETKKFSFAETLTAMSGMQPLSNAALKTLNELDEPKLAKFMAAWDGLAPDRRAYVSEKLAAQLEDEFELNYDPIFMRIMRDPDPRVRLAALEGLQFNSDDTLLDPLCEILRRDPSEDVRAEAADSLSVFMLAGVLGKLTERRHDKVYAALMGALLTEAETSPVYGNALIALASAPTKPTRILCAES